MLVSIHDALPGVNCTAIWLKMKRHGLSQQHKTCTTDPRGSNQRLMELQPFEQCNAEVSAKCQSKADMSC